MKIYQSQNQRQKINPYNKKTLQMEHSKTTSCACSKPNPLKKTSKKGGKKMSILNILTAVLLFLFPKCPLCWATYASLFSFIGLDMISYNSNWIYIVFGIFLIGSFLIIRNHYLNKSWINIVIYSLGMTLLFITYYFKLSETWWLYIILFLVALSNFSKRHMHKLINVFKRPFLLEHKVS